MRSERIGGSATQSMAQSELNKLKRLIVGSLRSDLKSTGNIDPLSDKGINSTLALSGELMDSKSGDAHANAALNTMYVETLFNAGPAWSDFVGRTTTRMMTDGACSPDDVDPATGELRKPRAFEVKCSVKLKRHEFNLFSAKTGFAGAHTGHPAPATRVCKTDFLL